MNAHTKEGGPEVPDARLEVTINEIAAELARRYKVTPEEAAVFARPILAANLDFCAALEKEQNPKRLKKMRIYKDTVAAIKRSLYFSLRRYRQNEASMSEAISVLESIPPGTDVSAATAAVDAVARAHISTMERLEHLKPLFDSLAAAMDGATSVLDVGGGVFPLIFDFERFPGVKRYLSLDRDKQAVAAVKAYGAWRGDGRVSAREWKVEDGWDEILDNAAMEDRFDVVLMLKVLPVVNRQSPELLRVLAEVPARHLVVTGSKEAMAKRHSIAHRERNVLTKFASDFGWLIRDEFETEDETGLVLEREL